MHGYTNVRSTSHIVEHWLPINCPHLLPTTLPKTIYKVILSHVHIDRHIFIHMRHISTTVQLKDNISLTFWVLLRIYWNDVQPIHKGRIHIHRHIFLHSLGSTAVRFCSPQEWLTSLMRSHKIRSTRDQSVPRSLLRWVSTKSSVSQLRLLYFTVKQIGWNMTNEKKRTRAGERTRIFNVSRWTQS